MTRFSMSKLSKSLVVSGLLLLLNAGDLRASPRDAFLYRLPAVMSTESVDLQEHSISYQTVAGFRRTVRFAVRKPPNASSPQRLPTVIWAHGGGEQPNGRPLRTVLPEWGETTARAGYLSITLLHGTNTGMDRLQLCRSIGFPPSIDPAGLASALNGIITSMGFAASMGVRPPIDVAALRAGFPTLFADLEDFADDERLPERVVERMTTWINGCGSVNALGLWDRPHDVAAVVNALHDGLVPELGDWVNPNKIAVAGHSNGTNSVLNAVGLRRALPNGVKVDAPFPARVPPERPTRRPVAAVALSPMGVNDYGLFDTTTTVPGTADSADHSWAGLTDIPVMTITGDGDERCRPSRFVCAGSDSTGKRLIPFFRMPPRDKYLMLVSDARAAAIVSSHKRFGSLHGAPCPEGSGAQCRDTEKWIKSTVIAFLDAYVRNWQPAMQ